MNKSEFIEELKNATSYSEEKCIIINDILENNFIIGKKGKEKIVESFKEKLSISDEIADELYNACINILGSEIKEKLKHPFKSQD